MKHKYSPLAEIFKQTQKFWDETKENLETFFDDSLKEIAAFIKPICVNLRSILIPWTPRLKA